MPSKPIHLTASQGKAVKSTDRNLIVSAGAGTGKTRVLVERFLHLLESRQALVNEILTLTFTEKAALEMKRRISERLAEKSMTLARRDFESAYISTIHAFASRLLKEHPIEAGVDPEFRILEEEEAGFFKEEAMDEAIQSGCGEDAGIFELLRIYGEGNIREALFQVFDAARTEGNSLARFFEKSQKVFESLSESSCEMAGKIQALIDEIKGSDAVPGGGVKKQILTPPPGTASGKVETLKEFQEWSKNFSRCGTAETKPLWKELSECAKTFALLQTERLTQPCREAFERLAISFETLYENRKREEAFLDFSDLEKKAVEFFLSERPANQVLLKRYREHFKFIMVDEFQDTNFLQSCLVQILSSGSNLFFVGDSKQSIYGFRGTSPQFFHEHEKRYGAGEGGARIALLENFRSSEGVLGWINPAFRELWAEDDFTYEDLIPGGAGKSGGAVSCELIRVEQDLSEGEQLEHARMREAEKIASHIVTLTAKEGFGYGDIVILFQAMTHSGLYEQALKAAGIPYFVVAGRGFYGQPEIRDVMSLLTYLDNPRSDIALAAVLRSPFVRVKDDTLFWLACHAKKDEETNPLETALRSAGDLPEIQESEKRKLADFRALTRELHFVKDRLSLAEFLEYVFQKTGYEMKALADPKGIRRYANLRKLVELARGYETHEKFSLTEFVRLIRMLDNRDARESEAQVESETGGQVVRLMTIHAAKGLEFPAVILADLAHKRRAEPKMILFDPAGNYAFQFYHPEKRDLVDTYLGKRIVEERKRREKDEWKRLFYVAATRAARRLVLSGVHKPQKTVKENYREMSSWMEWVEALLEKTEGRMRVVEPKEHAVIRQKPALAAKKEFQALWDSDKLPTIGHLTKNAEARRSATKLAEGILKQALPPEPVFSRVIDLPVSAYVAFEKSPEDYWKVYELGEKSGGDLKPGEISQVSGEELSAADFGTVIHGILEKLDFEIAAGELEEKVSLSLKALPVSQRTEAFKIIQSFMAGPLCGRLRGAAKTHRELAFVLNERHGRIYGVMDLLFQDKKGEWHLVDYKTAVGDPAKVKASGYELQIKIYALALKELLGVYPKTAALYFLKNNWVHPMELGGSEMDGFPEKLRSIQEEILSFTAKQRRM